MDAIAAIGSKISGGEGPSAAASPAGPVGPSGDGGSHRGFDRVQWSDDLLDDLDPARANGDPDKIYPRMHIPDGGLPLNKPGTRNVTLEEFMRRVDAMATDMASSLFHNGEMDNTPSNMREFVRRIANLRLSFGDVAPDELTKTFDEIEADRVSGRRRPPGSVQYL